MISMLIYQVFAINLTHSKLNVSLIPPTYFAELFSRIMGMRTLWGRTQGFCKIWNGTTPYVLISKPSAVEVSHPFVVCIKIPPNNPKKLSYINKKLLEFFKALLLFVFLTKCIFLFRD